MRTAERPATLRPPLKWAGGKRWQVPHLRPLWRRTSAAGSSSRSAAASPSRSGCCRARALLNDVNPHLINFYRWLQRGLRVDDLAMANDEALFYRQRDRFNALLADGKGDGREAAALFYYLNRTGYNGLCRFNRRGEFNVPFGRYTRIAYTRDFSAYRDAFADWTFTGGDFEAVPLEPTTSSTPIRPTTWSSRSTRKGGFTWDDQERTAEWLATHPGPVVLVNQATERVETLYRRLGYAVQFLRRRGASAGRATERRRARSWPRATSRARRYCRVQDGASGGVRSFHSDPTTTGRDGSPCSNATSTSSPTSGSAKDALSFRLKRSRVWYPPPDCECLPVPVRNAHDQVLAVEAIAGPRQRHARARAQGRASVRVGLSCGVACAQRAERAQCGAVGLPLGFERLDDAEVDCYARSLPHFLRPRGKRDEPPRGRGVNHDLLFEYPNPAP